MSELYARVLGLPEVGRYCRWEPGHPGGVLSGLVGAASSLVIGALARGRSAYNSPRRPVAVVLAVSEGPEAALELLADLRAWQTVDETEAPEAGAEAAPPGGPAGAYRLETSIFPAWDVLPTEADRPEGRTLADRRRVLERCALFRAAARAETQSDAGMPTACLIAAPVTALLQPCEDPGAAPAALLLRVGERHAPLDLGRRLLELGFERTGQVEVRGEYSLRGSILDLFPYTSDLPFRLDFDDDLIESIRLFEPLSQRSLESVDRLALADFSPTRLCSLFRPAAEGGPFTLLDHLPAGSLVVWRQPGLLRKRAELYAASLVSGRSLQVPFSQLRAQAARDCAVLDLLSPEDGAEERPPDGAEGAGRPAPSGDLACTSLLRLQGDPRERAAEWRKLAAARLALYLFCETPGGRKRLQELLAEAGVLPAPRIRWAPGSLSGGFDLRAAGLAALSEREILGRRKHAEAAAKAPRLPSAARPLSSLFELQYGDYVVHAAHGLARYLGLARLEQNGRLEDYLTLLFAEDVKLFVPATHIELVGKYIGGEARLELSRLGAKAWARKKERVARALRDIAEDLLRVQASRRSLPGICFGPDSEWQAAFETAFPFTATPDQLAACGAIKRDMEAPCPMDRLLCGDVGFGKTEVALRAAFKAAVAGKQVAVLAPTTLLCEQHGRTFAERFAGYPLNVETLSRFKPPREQKRILQRLAAGRVDVAIGTHRLLQKDVVFRDLGLVIVDEEQRFGVEHKEFFKRLRRSLDVLTLTATPIPRTLHLALIGLRDISNLATPPPNRRPIVTKVARVSEDLLRRAILRELSRGGQVFIVHPRVLDIEDFRERLARLVPEARFGIGHGQMAPEELEDAMARFLRGDLDVLVSTTIVENGLDIPTANTILVHEAHHFGLAELHQLRGRVGRSDVQAYAYLLLPEQGLANPEALRRLRALEEFDELGAGFQLALKDLELRGAGNILGAEQSGHIAEIGYALYCRLLENTVRELRGEETAAEIETNLRLCGPAYIPEEYVADEKAVLELYRRLDEARSDGDLEALREEAEDRFGPLPAAAARLFEESKLRRLARAARVPFVGVDRETARLQLKFHGWDLREAERILARTPAARGTRVLEDATLSFALPPRAREDERVLRETVRALLLPLAEHRERQAPTARPSGQQEPPTRSRAQELAHP